jgi:hypothetical protein
LNSYPPIPNQYLGWAELFNIAYLICACTGSAAAVSKAIAWWKERTPDLLALVAIRFVTVLAFLGGMPWIQDHLARSTDVPNIGTLITYPCIVLQSLASLLILQFWQRDRAAARKRARPLVALYAVLVPTMIALFLSADPKVNRPIDFDIYYATNWRITIFQLIYNVCFAAGLIGNIWMMRRYASMVPGLPWVRYGLNTTRLGSTIALGLFATKVPSLIALWFGHDQLNTANVVIGPLCSSVAALLHHLGATLPAWGSRLHQRWKMLTALFQMRKLWHDITQARPRIAFAGYAPAPKNALEVIWQARDLRKLLYRAVIEIRDGQRELRPYFDPDIAEHAHRLAADAGLDATSRQTAVDATVLAAAIRAQNTNAPARDRGTVELSVTQGDLAEEIVSLASLGRAYASSPIVAAALTR